MQDDNAKKGIANVIALFATLPNTFFLADFTKQKCDEFYYRYYDKHFKPIIQTSRPLLRKVINDISLFIGCLAAIANTYLAIENANPAALNALVPFSFLGSSLAQAKTMNMLLQSGIDYYDESRFPQLAKTQRDILIKLLCAFNDKILHQLDVNDLKQLQCFFSSPDVEQPVISDVAVLNRQGLFRIQESKEQQRPVLSGPSFNRA